MAIQFSQSVRNLFIGRGLLGAFVSPCSISVYSGVQPTSAQVTANWASYASTNAIFLNHYTGGTWTQPSNGIMMQLSTVPATQIALNSGTATWCILWTSAVTAANVAAGTLPNISFIVAPCSDSVGSGVVRFADPIFVSGATKIILDGSIGATF
jgi:hypothetical protein